MKNFINSSVRLLALMLCLAATVPQLWADDFYMLSSETTWDRSNLLNDAYKMTESNGEWTWSYTPTSPGDLWFRIVGRWSGGWYDNDIAAPSDGYFVTTTYQNCAWNTANAWRLTVEAGKTYTIYKNGNSQVKYSVADPVDPQPTTYYITGDAGLGLGGWTNQPTLELTDPDGDGIYTYTSTAQAGGTYYFVFANGQGSTWDVFNTTYRIGPTNGGVQVPLNGNYQTTQFAGGDNGAYEVTVAAGSVTFYFKPDNMTFKVEGTAPATYTYDIYVRYTGNEALNNVYAYAYGPNNSQPLGAWSGAALNGALFTPQDINGHTYYHTQFTTYSSQAAIIFNENGSVQTADLTLQVGDNYFTYGGGTTISGPSDAADPPIVYYITGSESLGLGWSSAPTTTMTYDVETGLYSYTYDVVNAGTHGFVFATGQGSGQDDGAAWNDFNTNYRVGPTNGDETVTLNGDWASTQRSNGDHGAYMVSTGVGKYTIYYDPTNLKFKVVGPTPIFITGDLGLGLGWSYAPANAMVYNDATGLYSYTYRVPNQGTYSFVFANGQATGFGDDNDGAWNYFNTNYRIGPTNGGQTVTIGQWESTQAAGGDNGAYSVRLAAGYVTIYFDNSTSPMRFMVESAGELGDDLYMVGTMTYGNETYNYAPNQGILMKYDNAQKLYYLNHVTLNTNSTFCFSTSLGSNDQDWGGLGTRYGNADDDELYFVPRGSTTAHLRVTGDKINVNMPLGVWDDDLGEWMMNTAGIYNVIVNLEEGWVKLIKTDQFTLFPMNVYLEQTDNVELDPGQINHTYNIAEDGDNPWPLIAWNRLEGDWNPNESANHYSVTYVGDTTTADGKKWWHWQVSASIAEVMFTRTNTAPYNSEIIARKAGVLWYTWEENNTMTDHSREYFTSSATQLPGNVEVEEGHYYVYFINTVGWETVYCVAWSSQTGTYYDGHGKDVQTWPGQPMVCIGIDPKTGYEVWEYDFGAIDDSQAPEGLLFHDGTPIATTDAKEQTGDFGFINGGVYDYLGLFDDAYTLNSLIRTAEEHIRYTVSNDLVGVYYDSDAVTIVSYPSSDGTTITQTVTGALYAKDLNDYGEKSIKPDGDEYTDYVYDICASSHTAGKSQIMDKRTEYDQSNWIKLVVSPNYDGRNHEPLPEANWPNLQDYVNHIIPGGTLDLYMTDSINPTARVMAITLGEAQTYEPNVYVSGHFNDSIVFNYTHREWQPKPLYGGTYRTQPFVNWITDPETGEVIRGEVTRVRVEDEPYKMFYVAPKPQEVAYLTWIVYDNLNIWDEEKNMRPYDDYESGEYMPYTTVARFLPKDPGRFFSPRNWDRSQVIPGDLYEELRYLSGDQLEDALGGYGTEFGPYSNGYMQYGGVKVNWSLFDEEAVGMPWWQIFQPGQAYKIMAIIRYARGNGKDYQPNECYEPSNGDEGDHGHTFNAPPRFDGNGQGDYANMYFTGDYAGLDDSKFIIFPILASADGSNGDGMGNVTTVQEVKTERDVVAVRYYNIMGVESSKPFDGLNIIVTTYSDGSRTSKKVLR